MTELTYKGKVYSTPAQNKYAFEPGDKAAPKSPNIKCCYDNNARAYNIDEIDSVPLNDGFNGGTMAGTVMVMGQKNAMLNFMGMEKDIFAISDLNKA